MKPGRTWELAQQERSQQRHREARGWRTSREAWARIRPRSRQSGVRLQRGPAMACRGCGCSCGPGHLNEDNALIVLYLLGGAAFFPALELAHERQAKERLANFSRRHNLSREELRGFFRH
ncbi:potassium channel subfamily K member 13-like [Saccopteryx bilineata]|uniref:potassium channel subfamily K member 13-like n=1 Tax=Saccopteryx bilineata TaxID=59482 RepID=UPI0033902148